MSKQYWIHQTSVFVITSNRLIFQAHFYKTSVCFHKLWTFLQFLGFLQLSGSVTVFLKVKLKGWFVAGWPLLPSALLWSLAQARGSGAAGRGPGGRGQMLAGLQTPRVWEQKRSTVKDPVTVHKAGLCPGGHPPQIPALLS